MQENQPSLYHTLAVDGFLLQRRCDKYLVPQQQHLHCCVCPAVCAAVSMIQGTEQCVAGCKRA